MTIMMQACTSFSEWCKLEMGTLFQTFDQMLCPTTFWYASGLRHGGRWSWSYLRERRCGCLRHLPHAGGNSNLCRCRDPARFASWVAPHRRVQVLGFHRLVRSARAPIWWSKDAPASAWACLGQALNNHCGFLEMDPNGLCRIWTVDSWG